MTMTDSTPLVVQNTRLRRDLAEAQAELAALTGDPGEGRAWLQGKVQRQRKALALLQKRVVAQRFALRLANQLGHVPSREEYLAAKGDPDLWDLARTEVQQ
jgi:hypothetical protein